ncbi:SMC-Scp complex subunit ScpB [Paracoccus alkanivorans]|uniref:SMC-Scp complex subunit ScpB n=1 Tax=Paracoccus alkanivorans TaxID=2116655 RepID=A0A3M0LZ36_9RHOB|nr:SMC-Scp complex subunit ScpB [Paracoccus alkanivorans]RMC30788.1 SMC-Scp complex subunit ScpB [Paracoccus alkanivorans]
MAAGQEQAGPAEGALDRELADLPVELRWREWLRRIEAVLFASAEPVSRDMLARVVGQGAEIDLLIADLRAELADRPYDLLRVGNGWALRTRPAYAGAIRAAAAPDPGPVPLRQGELALLAAIAWHQPITRAGLAALFGGKVSRDALAHLRARELIAPGPRSPEPGAPQTFVTTEGFLDLFGLEGLQDLPDLPAAASDPAPDTGIHWPLGEEEA